MSPSTYTEVTLAKRPTTYITEETFKHETRPFDLKPGPKEVLIRVDLLSLDPAMRGWVEDLPSYLPPVSIGARMRASGLGQVLEAGPDSTLAVGDLVTGLTGMTEYAVLKDAQLTKVILPPAAEPMDILGPLGPTGLTAYFGLLDVGKPKAGETLVVSGAAGATGSMVCQIGKIIGCKVIGIAGSDDKCSWLENELGVDKAINYKSPTFKQDLKAAAGYIDVFFDNVGGEILDVCLKLAAFKARIVICGAISVYNEDKSGGVKNLTMLIKQRIRMEGFVIIDYAKRYGEAQKEIATWIAQNKIKRRFTVLKGLSKVNEGLDMLFTGGNIGKVLLQLHSSTSNL